MAVQTEISNISTGQTLKITRVQSGFTDELLLTGASDYAILFRAASDVPQELAELVEFILTDLQLADNTRTQVIRVIAGLLDLDPTDIPEFVL
jgi:hypothetical protein